MGAIFIVSEVKFAIVWPKRPLDSVLTGVDLYFTQPVQKQQGDRANAPSSDLILAAHRQQVFGDCPKLFKFFL